MKRIAIFCDGTWNLTDKKDQQTNVVQLAQAVKHTGADGIKQVPIYVRGVGTGRGSNALARTMDKWLGGGLGWGLGQNVEEAYRALIFLYEPGDEIYIFGFSRGAYTARSLAGLLRKAGILTRSDISKVKEAMQLYRTRGEDGHPDSDTVQEQRAELSPDVATSVKDLMFREQQATLLKITYLGVWDTVGALGLPGFLGFVSRITNKKYSFHDTSLSSSVDSAWHAVALDERRGTFPPSLWGNLDTLNGHRKGALKPYQQMWFAGDHGSIGGGGEIRGLSAFTFGWIAQGAILQGLDLDETVLRSVEGLCAPQAHIYHRAQGIGAKALGFIAKDRAGPDQVEDVHPSVIDKIALGPKNFGGTAYKPGSLKRIWEKIPSLLPEKPS